MIPNIIKKILIFALNLVVLDIVMLRIFGINFLSAPIELIVHIIDYGQYFLDWLLLIVMSIYYLLNLWLIFNKKITSKISLILSFASSVIFIIIYYIPYFSY